MTHDKYGNCPELTETIRELHDRVYWQGKNAGVDEFIKYLFDNSILLDEYEKASILYYADKWKKEINNGT